MQYSLTWLVSSRGSGLGDFSCSSPKLILSFQNNALVEFLGAAMLASLGLRNMFFHLQGGRKMHVLLISCWLIFNRLRSCLGAVLFIGCGVL